jgi:uncharacterized protein
MTDAALTTPKPRIDHPGELDRLVRQIVEKVDPVAIYLFGSRARGDAREDSDYDLMVVVPDDAPREDLWQIVYNAARSSRISANAVVRRRGGFTRYRHEVGTLVHEVEVDGVQLWPRAGVDWRQMLPHARGSGIMNVKVVESWLRQVARDLVIARKGCEGPDAVPDQSAYHVQQAAEKLTKAALVAHRRRPRKGHDIEQFTSLLPDPFPLKDRFRRLERFSKYAWAHRYPEDEGQEPIPEPSVIEARAWIEEVGALKAAFEEWLHELNR